MLSGCDCIKASGDAASALSREHIEKMTEEEVKLDKIIALRLLELNPAFPTKAYNCLDTLGKLPWPQSSKAEIWAALLEKVSLLLYVSYGTVCILWYC